MVFAIDLLWYHYLYVMKSRSFDDYTTVADIIEQEKLDIALEDPARTFTVFAPQNEAILLLN